jgi:signal transduction histidine kinase
MRGLLGVLRNENQPVAIAPQPGLDRLPELIDTAACAGVPVRLTTTGTPLRVGAATGLTAYRIVQEGLANAARHAPGAAVTVRLDHQDGALEVGIVNSPADEPSPAGPPGHGLLGMRERAQAIGGRLDAGPLPDGGFSVLAVLPQRAPDGEQ